MQYKTPAIEKQYKKLPKMLRLIGDDADRIAQRFGKELTITRVADPVEGETGVHTEWRAFDARDEYLGAFTFNRYESEAIVNMINAMYLRKDEYETVKHHSFDAGPVHFHFQVPHYTRTL